MDWSNPVGSAVQGGFGLFNSWLNYRFNKKLAEQQNQYNLEMWNLQNEYNSPQAQMKRFEEAGLNPMLIYNQGSSGNATSAPQMVTPEAPDFSKDVRDLAQAFNIEGLKIAIANRKKAQAEARIAENSAYVQEEETKGINTLADGSGRLRYDPRTGMFTYLMPDGDGTGDYIFNRNLSGVAYSTAMKFLSDNFRTNALILPRSSLIGSQSRLNAARNSYLAPQIRMSEFNATPWRMKTNFWIGNVKNGVQAISPFFPYF